MRNTVSFRKIYISILVMGYLLRGIIYHVFPAINEILPWFTVIAPVAIVLIDLVKDRRKPDGMETALLVFLCAAVITSVMHGPQYLNQRVGDMVFPTTEDLIFSLVQAFGLCVVCFRAPLREDPERYPKFMDRLGMAAWLVICGLMLGSVILYLCYVNDISLPGGLGSADQIFTYGHLGEEMRFCGLFGYSNDGGNLCGLAAVLTIILAQRKRIPLWAAGCAYLLSACTIFLLDVRTSVVELLVITAIPVYYLLGKKIGYGRTILLVGITAALLVIAMVVSRPEAIATFMERFRKDPYDGLRFLTTGRSFFWDMSVQMFRKSPIFGQGWLNSQALGYFDGHNLFFNVLLWTGLSGILPLTVFAVLLIRHLVQNKRTLRECGLTVWELLLIAVLTESMLDRAILGTSHTGPETTFFWLTAGMLGYYVKKPLGTDDREALVQ